MTWPGCPPLGATAPGLAYRPRPGPDSERSADPAPRLSGRCRGQSLFGDGPRGVVVTEGPQHRNQSHPGVNRPREKPATQLDSAQRILEIGTRPHVVTRSGTQPSPREQWQHREQRGRQFTVHAPLGQQGFTLIGTPLVGQRVDYYDESRSLGVGGGPWRSTAARPSASAARRSPRRCRARPRSHNARANHCGEPLRSAWRMARERMCSATS